MTDIRPIQTRYKGYRFRSRLEARWAVFFDTLGAKWEYETQGYQLASGHYLPDFWLPEWGTWAEVKPNDDAANWPLLIELAEATGQEVISLAGAPDIRWYEVYRPTFEAEEDGFIHTIPGSREWIDLGASAHRCAPYHEVVAANQRPRADELNGVVGDLFGRAVAAARSARFEYGESGPG